MNSEMKHISQWLKANKLTLNSENTYYMVFHRGRRKIHNNITLCIDDAIIEEASTIKYLIVILDNKLNWTSYIDFVKNRGLRHPSPSPNSPPPTLGPGCSFTCIASIASKTNGLCCFKGFER